MNAQLGAEVLGRLQEHFVLQPDQGVVRIPALMFREVGTLIERYRQQQEPPLSFVLRIGPVSEQK